MAYQEYSIASLDDIGPLVSAFAADLGWVVSGTTAAPVLQSPDYMGSGSPGGMSFELFRETVGLQQRVGWRDIANPTNRRAALIAPILATEMAPDTGVSQTPTKLFLIGRLAPEPYLVAVVEFGYNNYRHLYLGNLERIGDYVGGEIISGSSGATSTYNGDLFFRNPGWMQHLFQGNETIWNANGPCGGVRVEHADNPNPWRQFRCPNGASGAAFANMTGVEAFGGFGDGFNDFYVQKGKNPLAGTSLLVPFDILLSSPVTNECNFVPVGRVAGARMLNIEALEAYSVITIGAETWHAFAAQSKRSVNSAPRPGNTGWRYRLYESSYYLGFAYRSA